LYYCTDASCDYGTVGGAVEIYGSVDGSNISTLAQNGDGFIEIGGGAAIEPPSPTTSRSTTVSLLLPPGWHVRQRVHDLRVDNYTIVRTPKLLGCLAWVGDTPSADTMSFRNKSLPGRL
jgi:hypothetical protein